ncbi:cytochrome-c peroxidase [Polymorphum gilvum]|uniref:Cytochrome-c peroxidase n=1 Tax=Polymorphum gilvum (strain LMG 25793 / CGMCC 1.9160 / SL003B-26A1) TaxID=991905 RepID=F2IZQ3_POLGS|nr:cytochrome-c peroxidase [Polymorphum gilvum]ADZ69610.1 Cytochrome-c peroxidase [Polymorphum gilvum SL003B-26A1]
MTRASLLLASLSVFALSLTPAQAQSELLTEARDYFQPIPHSVPTVADNPVTREKIDLGRMLFFDPRLSRSGLLSCNTCHNVGMGGDDNLETSIGHGWQKGPRNAPTVFNAIFNTAQFWDGRADDLKAQAKGPIQAGVEMANTPDRVEETLKSMPEYVERFQRAFSGEADAVTFDNMARAIEAFEATLITPASKFDLYLEGNEAALNDQEKEGLKLFMDTGCASCHGGVNFGGEGYYPFGVVEKPGADILPPDDKGRFAVTQTADEEYVFRAAPLRNIELTAPYFHSGMVWDLKQAVGIMATSQLGADLTDEQVEAITAFLLTLTGEQPVVEYPILPVSTSATPRPELMEPIKN